MRYSQLCPGKYFIVIMCVWPAYQLMIFSLKTTIQVWKTHHWPSWSQKIPRLFSEHIACGPLLRFVSFVSPAPSLSRRFYLLDTKRRNIITVKCTRGRPNLETPIAFYNNDASRALRCAHFYVLAFLNADRFFGYLVDVSEVVSNFGTSLVPTLPPISPCVLFSSSFVGDLE